MRSREIGLCIAENRASEAPAVRVALASALERCDCAVIAFITPEIAHTLGTLANNPKLEIRHDRPGNRIGWDVKPFALKSLLEEGFVEVWWLDSDALVLRDLPNHYSKIDPAVLLVAEESLYGAHDDHGARARAWHLSVLRDFRFTLNSCLLRVSQQHVPILDSWIEMLNSEAYVAAQSAPWEVRPFHLLGDQDALTALLCSRSEHEWPVRVLQRGRDIIQYFGPYGYTLRERVTHLLGETPSVVHSQGYKPWRECQPVSVAKEGYKRWFDSRMASNSPYLYFASAFCQEGEAWISKASPSINREYKVGFRKPWLLGLPYSVLADAQRVVSAVARSFQKAARLATR